MPKRIPGALVAFTVALGLVAGGGTTAAGAAGRPADDYANAPIVTVRMLDNTFVPQTLVIDPGTVVRWVNHGRTSHNVIVDVKGRGWKSSKKIRADRTHEHQFTEPGVYGYSCTLHGAPRIQMYGTIIVKNEDGTVPASVTETVPEPRADGTPRTIRVPKQARTIQAAVDRAAPGDLVLIAPGVHREAVTVTTPDLVIRGVDRNRTILDGEYRLDNGVKVLGADGVAVENLTARRYTVNGFFWTGVDGYRGSYLTATRNGDYAIYAFDSVNGIFDHSYGSGSPDAGFYIGQCYPCNALITDSEAEWNGLGYSGTNAGGNLFITNSVWHHNRAGIVPNSGDGELLAPQHETTIVGNLVVDNNNARTPAIDAALLAQDNGILVAGGNDNLITRNRVHDHRLAGIALLPNPDITFWTSSRNRVEANVVTKSGDADLGAGGGEGNCFVANRFRTSLPRAIEQVLPCDGGTPIVAVGGVDIEKYLAQKPESVDYRAAKTPRPPALPVMRRPKTAPPVPANAIVIDVDLDAITVPRLPRRLR